MKKLLLSVIDAAEVLGIGKNKMYEIVHAGHLCFKDWRDKDSIP